MSSFNPDLAVPEPDETEELDDMFASLDRKVKAMRTQLFAEVVKEIAKSAKEERKKLLEQASKDFAKCVSECVQPELEKLSSSMTQDVAKKQEAIIERLSALESRSKDRHTSLVSRLQNLQDAEPEDAEDGSHHKEPATAPDMAVLAEIKAKLEGMEGKMATRNEEPVKPQESPKKRFRFVVKRNLHNLITEVEACEE